MPGLLAEWETRPTDMCLNFMVALSRARDLQLFPYLGLWFGCVGEVGLDARRDLRHLRLL